MSLRQVWSLILVIIIVEGFVCQRRLEAQTESVRLQRIFVPQGQIGEVVPRDYMPMSIDEMEDLIEAAESSQSGLRTDRPRLLTAKYTASLVGQSLVSNNSRWDLSYNDDSPGYFVVNPLNLSIAPQVVSNEDLGIKAFRNEAKSKVEASEPWMVDSQGVVSLPVNESGSFTFGWSSFGTRDSNGELHFRLSVPNAPRSCLLLKLPSGYSIGRCSSVVVKVPITSITLPSGPDLTLSEAQIGSPGELAHDEAGSLLEHSPADHKTLSFEKNLRELFVMSGFYELSHRRNAAFPIDLADSQSSFWLIEFGGDSQLAIDLVPPRSQDRTAWNEVISSMNSSYEATTAGVQLQTRIEAKLREETSQLDLELQGGLRVREVRIDGQPTNWQLLPGSDPVIRIPLPFRTGATRTVQVQVNCVAPALSEISSPLPSLMPRESMVLRGEGSLTFAEPLMPGVGVGKSCELRPMAATSSQRSRGWEWSWAGRVPSLEFSASSKPLVADVRTLSRLTVLPGSIDATSWIRIPSEGVGTLDSSFVVSEGWIIDSLTIAEKSVDYETTVEPQGTRVTLRLPLNPAGVPATQPEQYKLLELVAHRALDSDEANFAIPEFQLVRFRDAKQLDTYIVDPLSRFVVEPSSEILRMRIKDDVLQEWQRALLPRLSNSWLLQAGNQPLPSMQFSKQPATFSAQIAVDASLHNTELEESYSVKCRPLSGSLDRVVVRLSRTRDTVLPWRMQQGDQEIFLQAERVVSADGVSEEYRIQLPKAVTDTVELKSSRWSAWKDPHDLSIPMVELVSTQEIEVRLASPLTLNESAVSLAESITRLDPDRNSERSEEYRLVGSWLESPFQLALRKDVAASQWAPNVFHQKWYFNDGRVLHQSSYAIENNGRIRVDLTLPKDSELDSVLLDGIPVEVKRGGSENEVQIEQATEREHSRLAVRYRSNSSQLTFVNHVEFNEPIVNLAILESRTVVWLPANYVNLDDFALELSSGSTGWRFAKARFWDWVLLGRQPIPVRLLQDLGDWDPLEDDFVASPIDERMGDLNSSGESSTASWLQWRKMNGISWFPITMDDGIQTIHRETEPLPQDMATAGELDPSSSFNRTVWDLRQLRIWFLTGWIVVLMLSIGVWRLSPLMAVFLNVTGLALSFYADPIISVFSFAGWSAFTLGGFVYAIQKGVSRLQFAESPSVPYWQFLSAPQSKAKSAVVLLAAGISIAASMTAEAQDDKVYGVVIPIDSQGEVPGQYVYVPIEAYEKLTRASQASPAATSSFVYRSANYSFRPYANAEMMGGPSGQLTAEFEIDVREPAIPIFWPIGTESAKLDRLIVNSQEIIPGFTVRQDDTGIRWQSERTGIIKVKLVLIPKSTSQDEWSSLRLPIPPIPTAQVEFIGSDNFVFRCDSLDGEKVGTTSESQLAIGPLKELRIRWRGRESRAVDGVKSIRFTSDSWVHLDRNDTFAITRLQGTGATTLPSQYALLMDSRWQPIGSDWGGVRWSGVSETASAGINRYNVSRSVEQASPAEIVVVWRLKRADSIAEGTTIPFATIEGGTVASRTCTWSGSTDAPWQVQFPENWQLQPVEFVAATWSKNSPARARAIAIETGSGRLPTLTRAAVASSVTVDEINEIHFHRRNVEIEFRANWQGSQTDDQLKLLIPAGAVLGDVKVNGTPAVYHRSNRSATSDLLSIVVDSEVAAMNVLEATVQLPFQSGQDRDLPRLVLTDVESTSSVIDIYRDLEVELAVEPKPGSVDAKLPLSNNVEEERLEVAFGRYQFLNEFRQEAEVPLRIRIIEGEDRSELTFITELDRANERWLVKHRIQKTSSTDWPAALVFAVTTQSGAAQLGSDFQMEPNLPVRVETSPDGSLHYVIVAMDPNQKTRDALELRFEVSPPAASPFQVPEIRFLGRSASRQFLVVPTISESKSIDWLISGLRPVSAEEHESLGISEEESKLTAAYLVDAARYQAIQQTRVMNESVKPVPLVSHVVVSTNDERWKAQTDIFLANVGKLWIEFEVPEDVAVLGVQIGLETVPTTRNGNTISVPISPSDLPACVRIFSAGRYRRNGDEIELNLVRPRHLEVKRSNLLMVAGERYTTARDDDREAVKVEALPTFHRDRIEAVSEVVTSILKSPGTASRLELAAWYKPWRRSINADVRLLESAALKLPSSDMGVAEDNTESMTGNATERTVGEQQIAKATLETLRVAEDAWIATLADESIDTLKDTTNEMISANLMGRVSTGKQMVFNADGILEKVVLQPATVETPSFSSDRAWIVVALLLGAVSAVLLSTWLRSPMVAATRSPAMLLAVMGIFLAAFLPVWQIGGVLIVVAFFIGLVQSLRGLKHRRRFIVRASTISRSPSR